MGREKYSPSRYILKVCFPNHLYVDCKRKMMPKFWARVMERMGFPLTEMEKTVSEAEEINRGKSEVEFEVSVSRPNRNAEWASGCMESGVEGRRSRLKM